MRRRRLEPTIDNILRLFSKRLGEYKGESHRSYRKAYSSFQIYVVTNYSPDFLLTENVLENWLTDNQLHGLSLKTVSFYLDKISSLYSGVAIGLKGGLQVNFKELKRRWRALGEDKADSEAISRATAKMRLLWTKQQKAKATSRLLENFLNFENEVHAIETSRYIWGCMALSVGVRGDVVRSLIGDIPRGLKFLEINSPASLSEDERNKYFQIVKESLYGESPAWFAMRLRPGVKFEDILYRFSLLQKEINIPELFYPCDEVARLVGRKVVWKGRPVIRDVVFFKYRKGDIYPLFCRIYDLAWCYRRPGGAPGNYAEIPEKAMDNFKSALGLLSPDYEVAPQGEMELKPGDEVIVITAKDVEERGRILKKPSYDEDGNKIFRVTLLDRNGRWDMGIDARLIKKA